MTKEFTSFKNYLMDEIVKYHRLNEYSMMILFSKKQFNYYQNFNLFSFIIIVRSSFHLHTISWLNLVAIK